MPPMLPMLPMLPLLLPLPLLVGSPRSSATRLHAGLQEVTRGSSRSA